MASNDNSKTILIVDDSKVSRMVIKANVLAVHPDWQVMEAGTGERPSPGTATRARLLHDGHQHARHAGHRGCRTDPAGASVVRIAIFSANIQEAVQTRAQQLGALFVAKPVTEKSIGQALLHFRGQP
jgi:CheY-like chemotaxis protein